MPPIVNARSGAHPYEVLGGGVGGRVHNPAHFVRRPDVLVLNPTESLCFATVRDPAEPSKTHRIFYSRLFGGQFRERTLAEKTSCAHEQGPIKLLFVQGLAGTHAQWMQQIEFFAQDARYDLVAVDNRGVGLSDTPDTWRWKTSDLAHDVASIVVDELGWDKVHLIGFSLGGMVALECAALYPHLWASVTLASTHAGGLMGTAIPPWGILPFLRTFAHLGHVTSLDRGMELLHPSASLDRTLESHEIDTDLAQVAEAALGPNAPISNRFKVAHQLIQRARKYVESGNGPEIRPPGVLKQITAAATHYVSWGRLEWLRAASGIPFFIVAGEQDNLVASWNAYMLASALDAPLFIRDDAGHGVTDQYSAEINLALQRHIEAARNTKFVEGRRAVQASDAVPSGSHPWFVAASSFAVLRLLLGRSRRWLSVILTIALLRAVFGPLWKRERRARVL